MAGSANPTFEKYASLSAEELQSREDFYRNLWNPGLGVTRTILLKTNMQLSAETMRSSLQAEWELLTEEAKTKLVESSLSAMASDAELLEIIQNTAENPCRCSCAQSAPPELNANPECCARGTELAFTWLKNGDLEVGRIFRDVGRARLCMCLFVSFSCSTMLFICCHALLICRSA